MAAKLVWIREDGSLTCDHPQTSTNGHHGPYEGEYYCDLCALHTIAAFDQSLAAVAEAAQEWGDIWDAPT